MMCVVLMRPENLLFYPSIGFRANVTFDDVLVEGIEKIDKSDIQYAKDMGYTIKLLTVALRQENGIALNVYPAFCPIIIHCLQ